MRMRRPADNYDPAAWAAYWASLPPGPRSLGAAADDDDPDGGAGAEAPPDDGDAEGGTEDTPSGQVPETGKGKAPGQEEIPAEGTAGGDLRWAADLDDPQLKAFASESPSLKDFVQRAFNQRQKLSTAIVKPGKNAGEDAIRAFHKALGVPDSPEKYAVQLPGPEKLPEGEELDPDLLKGFLAAMHKAGTPPAGVQAGLDWYAETFGRLQAQQRARIKEEAETQDADLRQRWGADYEANVEVGLRALEAFWPPEFADLLEEASIGGVKMGNHPMFIEGLARVGRRMGERTGFSAMMGDDQKQTLQERIDELEGFQHADINRYKSPAVQRELRGLYEQLHGNAPAVGPGLGG